MTITTCVFDAYGTLFDVSAAARSVAAETGREEFAAVWERVSADWRDKQLAYSWLRAASGTHVDFWEVTQHALDWALDAAGLETDDELRARLLSLYHELDAYPEVPAMLRDLKAAGRTTAILSNGAPSMLEAAIASAGIADLLGAMLSAESVGVFKPSPRVYEMVGDRLGTRPSEVLFVSSNGWDAAYAANFGFETVWVNRAGAPRERLPGRPHHILPDLSRLSEFAR